MLDLDNSIKFEIQEDIWDSISKMKEGVWIVEHTPKRKAYIFLCDRIDDLPELMDIATLKRFEPEIKSVLKKKFNKIKNKVREGNSEALRVNDVVEAIYKVLRRKKR